MLGREVVAVGKADGVTTRASKLSLALRFVRSAILAPWYGPGSLNGVILDRVRDAIAEDEIMERVEDGPSPERVDALREARAWAALQRAAYASDGETPQRVAYGDMVNYLDDEIVKWSRGSEAAE